MILLCPIFTTALWHHIKIDSVLSPITFHYVKYTLLSIFDFLYSKFMAFAFPFQAVEDDGSWATLQIIRDIITVSSVVFRQLVVVKYIFLPHVWQKTINQ